MNVPLLATKFGSLTIEESKYKSNVYKYAKIDKAT